MLDLHDGQSVAMQGSAAGPYILKNVGGVLSCTCPAWRNQSLPIDVRTCKHLRKLLGDAAEEARLGSISSVRAEVRNGGIKAPPLLLAETWNQDVDPTGWLMSEKLDGVRAYWDGKQFLSRQGNRYFAPDWFTAGLPLEPLDGELWIGRKKFQRTVSTVRRQNATDLWGDVRFVIFDAPGEEGGFEARLKLVDLIVQINRPAYAVPHPHIVCTGKAHLENELARIEGLGGEGLMLRRPGSRYESGRSSTLLKVKSFKDDEALVVGHQPGAGRHKGRLGALLVEMANGTQFAVGTGFSDAERESPPPIGSTITFRYQELSDGGVPRFPSYVGVRQDFLALPFTTKGELTMPGIQSKRRFELVEGTSDKFWEISTTGKEVTVRFGRNGTNGQTSLKSFPDEAAVAKHVEKLVKEKTGKGYVEVP